MQKLIPLSKASPGSYRIVSLNGGKNFVQRMAEMGMYPDSPVEVLEVMNGGGPVRVSVKGSQLAIGRGMAAKIMVASEGEKDFYTLKDYREGDRGRIIDIKGHGKFKTRVLEMGFTKGEEVYVEKYAPLRDPIEFVVKGYHVSLRRDEAENIIMTPPERTEKR